MRSFVKKINFLNILYYVIDDLVTRLKVYTGFIGTTSGTRHETYKIDESIKYIEKIYNDYFNYGKIEKFSGKVAEIGHGDNIGVGLLIKKNGASEVHCIDRFFSERNEKVQNEIYKMLSRKHQLDELFPSDNFSEKTAIGIRAIYGQPAETFFVNKRNEYMYIVSRAVFEHLYDPLQTLDSMMNALEVGGKLIHRVDLRDHGMFAGKHPLTFLKVGDLLYSLMTKHSGRPNRVLLSNYKDWIHQKKISKFDILVTRLVGIKDEIPATRIEDIPNDLMVQAVNKVEKIKPNLSKRFREMPSKELAVSGIVLVIEK